MFFPDDSLRVTELPERVERWVSDLIGYFPTCELK
jgi:hypothetical protein